MKPRDSLLGILVAAAWGLNFVAIGEGLEDLPPLLFVGLRFALTALPAVFFVRPPDVPARMLVALGLLVGVGQFGLLFLGIAQGMPAGMSSVVLQAQMPITVLIGVVLLRERPGARQLAGLAVAVAGLVVIAGHRGGGVPLAALLLVLGAGGSWACANVLARVSRSARPFSMLVHSSLTSGICLLALSAVFEGPHRDAEALGGIGVRAAVSLAYIVVVATLVGYGAWYWLLGRYASSTVAAFPLLAPVAGLSSTWLVLDEKMSLPLLAGSALVVAGVGYAIWSSSRAGAAAARPAAPLSAAAATLRP